MSNTDLCIQQNGTALSWGDSTALGDLSLTAKSSPVAVAGGIVFPLVSVGLSSAMGLTKDGIVWSWGANSAGQLGLNTTTNVSSPVAVVGSHVFTRVTFGGTWALGLKSTGEVWAWGNNNFGQLGDLTTASKSSPILVLGNHSFIQIAAGNYSSGLKANGEIWSWGRNNTGQHGNNTTGSTSSPVIVIGNHSFVKIACGAGSQHALALKSNGEVWAWGFNDSGELGDLTRTSKSSPILVLGNHSFIDIFKAQNFSMALKSDGSCWCWGLNTVGQIGDYSTTSSSSPVLVVGNHNFIQIAVSGNPPGCAGLKRNGEVWTWGEGLRGQLGNNVATISSSSPILVVGGYKIVSLWDQYRTTQNLTTRVITQINGY